ncbi:MAG: peptidase M19, partial [bacterium]
MKKIIKVVVVLLFLAAGGFLLAAPAVIEKMINPVLDPGPHHASDRAVQLHKELIVADLHADSLMCGRNLLARGNRGHVDVPRLIEGNVAIQAFTVVTKSPMSQNIYSTPDSGIDAISIFAVISRWPRATWGSLKERALF